MFVLSTVISPGNTVVKKEDVRPATNDGLKLKIKQKEGPVKVVQKSQTLPEKKVTLSDLSKLTKVQLEEICNQLVMDNFGPFYQNWIASELEGMTLKSPVQVEVTLRTLLENHVKKIQDYVNDFVSKKPLMKKYSVLKFELEMRYLVYKISEMTGIAFEFEIAKEKISTFVGEDFVEYTALVKKIRSIDITPEKIEDFRSLFFEVYPPSSPSTTISPELNPKVEEIKTHIVTCLLQILNMYANVSGDSRVSKLSAQQHETLQRFFDAFYSLIELKKLKEFVLSRTIGESVMIQESHKFFTSVLFSDILLKGSKFDGLIQKDRFLFQFEPDINLLRFYESAQHALVSQSVFKIFDPIEYRLLQDHSNQKVDAKKKRKQVLTYYSIYKVYIIARSIGIVKRTDKQELVPILSTLFEWIAKAEIYEESTVSDEGQLVDLHKNVKEFFPREEFAHFYIPMLLEICLLIPNCQITEKEKTLKISDNFVKLGHYEDLFKPEQLYDIPSDFKLILETKTTVVETHTFLHSLEEDITLNNIDTKILDDETGGRIDSILDIGVLNSPLKEIKTPRGTHSPTDNNKLNDIFLKFEKKFQGILTPQSMADPNSPAKLKKFVDTIFDSGNVRKKNVSITLLFRLLMKLDLSKPENSKLTDIVLDEEFGRIRTETNFESMSGLRNFFHKTLLTTEEYEPLNMDDQTSYSLDLVVFLFYNYVDQIKQISADTLLSQEEKKKKVKELTDQANENKRKIMYSGIEDTNLNQIHKNWKSLRSMLFEMGLPSSKRKQKINPLIFEKLLGVKFIYQLRGFFNYYKRVGESRPEDQKYYRIYLQFYQFIGHLRRLIVHEVADPDKFVMEKLSECLDFTKRLEVFTDEAIGDAVCKFSHRKYSEMLFFFKSYLIEKGKTTEFDSAVPGVFNVHTRSYLSFTKINSDFSKIIGEECSTAKTLPICVSNHMFKEVMVYVSNPDSTLENIQIYLNTLPNSQLFASKINIINGLEAAYFWVQSSTPVSYAKFTGLFQFGLISNSPLKKSLKFEKQDKDQLSDYLSRTYKKAALSEDENNLAKIVMIVMEFSLMNPGSQQLDLVGSFLNFGGHFIPYYIKLFLQYSVKKKHYDLLAELMIEKDVNIELIKINDPSDDLFYFEFVRLTKSLSGKSVLSEGTSLLRNHLRAKYEMAFKLCEATSKSIVQSNPNILTDEDDLLAELLFSEEDQKESKAVAQEDQTFQSFNSKIGESVHKSVEESFSQVETTQQKLDLINSAHSVSEETFKYTVVGEVKNYKIEISFDEEDESSEKTGVSSSVEVMTKGFVTKTAPKITIGGNTIDGAKAEFFKREIQLETTKLTEQLLQAIEEKKKTSQASQVKTEEESTTSVVIEILSRAEDVDNFKTEVVANDEWEEDDEWEGEEEIDEEKQGAGNQSGTKPTFKFNFNNFNPASKKAKQRQRRRLRKEQARFRKDKEKGNGIANAMKGKGQGGARVGKKGGRKLVL